MQCVNLKNYNNDWYKPGGTAKRLFWCFFNMLFFKSLLPYPSGLKSAILRFFGASIGSGIVIKPDVNIKYPWFLTISDNCWIGEGVWIDNLTEVVLGSNVVLSQGAYLLTGSHDYKKEAFDLRIGKIIIEDGVWIGAKAVVCPDVTCKTHSILAVSSVATGDLEPYTIYQGNPATPKRERVIA